MAWTPPIPRGRNGAVVLVCTAAGIAAAVLLWKSTRSSRRKKAPPQPKKAQRQGLALTSPAEVSAFQGSLPRRLFLAPFVAQVKLVSADLDGGSAVLQSLVLFRGLRELDLSGNKLAEVPEAVLQLHGLTRLNLSRNCLTSLPAGISGLSRLEDLDLGRNELSCVPEELGALTQLRTLNLMANKLTSLPEALGKLTSVFRLGLKSNALTSLPESLGEMAGLMELFITDNQLTALPPSIGKLAKLFKLQASFNCLASLPAEMGQLPNLELLRVAVNKIPRLPQSFENLNRLAWFSLAGNPACAALPKPRKGLRKLPFSSLKLGEKLGDGASGDVFEAVLTEGESREEVVFKQFKAETSPDGHCRDESAITAALDHPHLTSVLATVDNPKGLLLQRVYARAMADKPNFDSLLRCRWAAGQAFSLEFVLHVAQGVASALQYLHARGICHGDVYAHNIMTTPEGYAVLCDFGASFCYDTHAKIPFEAQEVRAYGLFLKDLHARVQAPASRRQAAEELQAIVFKCVECTALERPAFSDIVSMLSALLT